MYWAVGGMPYRVIQMELASWSFKIGLKWTKRMTGYTQKRALVRGMNENVAERGAHRLAWCRTSLQAYLNSG